MHKRICIHVQISVCTHGCVEAFRCVYNVHLLHVYTPACVCVTTAGSAFSDGHLQPSHSGATFEVAAHAAAAGAAATAAADISGPLLFRLPAGPSAGKPAMVLQRGPSYLLTSYLFTNKTMELLGM